MQYLRRDTYAFTEKRNHVLYRGRTVCDGRKPECSVSAKVCMLLSENSLLLPYQGSNPRPFAFQVASHPATIHLHKEHEQHDYKIT